MQNPSYRPDLGPGSPGRVLGPDGLGYTGSMKVYLVDDASFIRLICRYHLTRAGFEILGEAHEGHKAEEEIRALQPDCVIMDMALPGKNGMEIMRDVQQQFPQIQFIVVSALDKDIIDATANGVTYSSFLAKPFEGADLVAAVQAVKAATEKKRHG